MDLLGSPGRTLISIVLFMLAVIALATAAYMGAGWSFADASYMVLLTVYTVGYGEVHPIATPYLHGVTVALMILGCTGMILLTGALVQFLTITQLQQIFGGRRVKAEIDKLENHVIVIGFGRIGVMLAKELKAGGAPFVVLEQNEKRAAEVRELGLSVPGGRRHQRKIAAGGRHRARAHPGQRAAQRRRQCLHHPVGAGAEPRHRDHCPGRMPSTESKLIQAGANKVVLPTHIGAERIAELILFPETARMLRTSEMFSALERTLRGLGLDMAVVVVPEKGALTGLSIEQIERRAEGRILRRPAQPPGRRHHHRPDRGLKVQGGDGVVIVSRSGQAARAMFEAPAGEGCGPAVRPSENGAAQNARSQSPGVPSISND